MEENTPTFATSSALFGTFSSILRVREKLLLILASALEVVARSSPPPDSSPRKEDLLVGSARLRSEPESPSQRCSIQSRLLLLCQQFDDNQSGKILCHAWQTLARQLMPQHWKQLMQFSLLFVVDQEDAHELHHQPVEPPMHGNQSQSQSDDRDKLFEYIEFLDFVFFPAILLPYRLHLQQPLGKCDVYEQHQAVLIKEFTPLPTQNQEIGKQVLVKHFTLPSTRRDEPSPPSDDSNNSNNSVASQPAPRDTSSHEQIAMLRFKIHHLSVLRHVNLVRYCLTLQQQDQVFVVQEMHQSCTLKTTLQAFGAMKESTIRRYLLQLLHALVFLHQHGIPHGNLHCESVYIDSCGLLKCGEFFAGTELRKLANGPWQPHEVDWALRFPPPECLRNSNYRSKKSDLWTVGILALQMQAGYGHLVPAFPPAPTTTNPNVCSPINRPSRSHLHPPLPDAGSTTKEFRMLIRHCLEPEPSKRMDAMTLLALDFFQVDPSKETQQVLKSVCSDLDASMRRLERAVSPRKTRKDSSTTAAAALGRKSIRELRKQCY